MTLDELQRDEPAIVTQVPKRGSGTAVVAILVAGAGWVHVVAVLEHWAHPHLAGFFVAASVLQLSWACLAASSPTARLLWTGLAGNAGLFLLWCMSRTTGVSFVPGLGLREPVGSADLAASGLELVAVIGLALMLTSRTARLPAVAAGPLVTATAVVTFFLVLMAGASSTAHHHEQDHHHDRQGTQFSPVGEHVQEDR